MKAPAAQSKDDRAAAGKAARAKVPRSSHGEWAPASDRPDPVDVLEAQSADRLRELIPLRYGRMLASPFTFYRGAASIMAADLAPTPVSGFTVQACGDAHLSNFGTFAAPNRSLVVDVNDFDETLPGPWEWDVKRLAASFEIAGRSRDFTAAQRQGVVRAATSSYRRTMREMAGMGNLDVWYSRTEVADLRARMGKDITSKERVEVDRNLAKAERKTRLRAFSKLTHRVDGELRIVSDPPVLVPLEQMYSGAKLERADKAIRRVLGEYRETLSDERRHLLDGYRYVHAARKVVGVGSVGTRVWIALFVGRDEQDPLFLQVKEADPSVLEPYAAPSEFTHQGQRVVEGQRLTQAAGDILLGWFTAAGPDGRRRDFYVRQLWDEKGSSLVERMSPPWMTANAKICGGILARAHARSGDRIAIASYLGSGEGFDRAVTTFAGAYADQNERDYDALADAVGEGRVDAELNPA